VLHGKAAPAGSSFFAGEGAGRPSTGAANLPSERGRERGG
jgi:hypothetical protein